MQIQAPLLVLSFDFGLKLGLKLNLVVMLFVFREMNFTAYPSLGSALGLLAAGSPQDFAVIAPSGQRIRKFLSGGRFHRIG